MVLIELKRENLLTLVFHLNVMRKAVRKGLKKKYNRTEEKKYMDLYNSLCESFPKVSDDLNREAYRILITNEQYEMLKSFLNWYESELIKGLGDNPSEKQLVGLEMLQDAKKEALLC